jgi:putative N-acetyltransferase (TIGR04045 family)
VLRTGRVAVECRSAATADELAAHYAVRHAVFVTDQRVFAESDRDPHDDDPRTVHVVGMVDDVVGGTVRLFPLDGEPGLWQGDRLAVLHEYRLHGLGGPLVRYAVHTAAELGGRRMVAYIQLPNVTFFERLGWHRDKDVEIYAGVPHQPMAIDLQP